MNCGGETAFLPAPTHRRLTEAHDGIINLKDVQSMIVYKIKMQEKSTTLRINIERRGE